MLSQARGGRDWFVKAETTVLTLYPSLALPRLRGVGRAQSLEGAYQEISTVVSISQHLPVLPGKETWAPF